MTNIFANAWIDAFLTGEHFYECINHPEKVHTSEVVELMGERLKEAQAHNYDIEWILNVIAEDARQSVKRKELKQ